MYYRHPIGVNDVDDVAYAASDKQPYRFGSSVTHVMHNAMENGKRKED